MGVEIMRKTKLIKTGDGELAIQFTDEELAAVGWKEGDEFEWIKTEDGKYKLMKINTQEEDVIEMAQRRKRLISDIDTIIEGNFKESADKEEVTKQLIEAVHKNFPKI